MALLNPKKLGFEDVELSSAAEGRQNAGRKGKRDLPLGQANSSQKNEKRDKSGPFQKFSWTPH